MGLKKGSTAQLNMPVIVGTIIKTRYDEESEQLEHLLEYKDANDVTQQRWFLESALKEV